MNSTLSGIFHSMAVCHYRIRNVKCAGEHISAEWPKPFEDPCKCANYSCEHAANYRLCSKFSGDQVKENAKYLEKNQNLKSSPIISTRKVKNACSFVRVATSVVADPPQ